MIRATLWLFCAFSIFAQADTVKGRVVKVPTPGSVEVKDGRNLQVVRLAGLGPLGKAHPRYLDAKKRLERLALRRQVSVVWDQRDSTCRNLTAPEKCPIVGRVFVDGHDLAVLLLAQGFAVHSLERLDELSTTDRTVYSEAEDKAKLKQLGIWRAPKTKARHHASNLSKKTQ